MFIQDSLPWRMERVLAMSFILWLRSAKVFSSSQLRIFMRTISSLKWFSFCSSMILLLSQFFEFSVSLRYFCLSLWQLSLQTSASMSLSLSMSLFSYMSWYLLLLLMVARPLPLGEMFPKRLLVACWAPAKWCYFDRQSSSSFRNRRLLVTGKWVYDFVYMLSIGCSSFLGDFRSAVGGLDYQFRRAGLPLLFLQWIVVRVRFLCPPSRTTFSTLSSQSASLSRHLERVTTSLSPSDLMSSLWKSLMSPLVYLAPFSVMRLMLSSVNSFSLTSLRRISWLKRNLPSSLGGTSLVRGRAACSTTILQGNFTFILIERRVSTK